MSSVSDSIKTIIHVAINAATPPSNDWPLRLELTTSKPASPAASARRTPQPQTGHPLLPHVPASLVIPRQAPPSLHPGEGLGLRSATISGSGPRIGTYLPPLPPGAAGGQRSPASSNGPNGRAEPHAEKRGAAPGAGAHLRARPPDPGRRPPPARTPAPIPVGRRRPSPGGRVTIPAPGEVLTFTAPGCGGETPLGVLDLLAQPRGPAQARLHAEPGPTAPPPPPAPAFPAPGRAPPNPSRPPPLLPRFARPSLFPLAPPVARR
nr:PREDICTED: basic proline-rich protein-like [Bos indicus]